jgi:hypothetical protein
MFHLIGDKEEYDIYGPYDPSLPPGEVVNCRCRILPHIERYAVKKNEAA